MRRTSVVSRQDAVARRVEWANAIGSRFGKFAYRGIKSVARYFFHFSDGQRIFSDDRGQEFHGLAAARRHAVTQVRELKAAMCDRNIRDLSGWTMMVSDLNGKAVFEIGFDLRPPRPTR